MRHQKDEVTFVYFCQGFCPNLDIARQLQHKLLQRSCISSAVMPAMYHVMPAMYHVIPVLPHKPEHNWQSGERMRSLQIIQNSAQCKAKFFLSNMPFPLIARTSILP
jgi:hypothetical protein